jgi:hypothetical protein
LVDRFASLGEAGAQHIIISTADGNDPDAIERLGAEVLPQLASFEPATPRAADG